MKEGEIGLSLTRKIRKKLWKTLILAYIELNGHHNTNPSALGGCSTVLTQLEQDLRGTRPQPKRLDRHPKQTQVVYYTKTVSTSWILHSLE